MAAMIGHTALRMYVMGEEATEREATEEEISRQRELVTEALEAGALGFATSRFNTHVGYEGRPVPSRLATPEEIIRDRPSAGRCRRHYASHTRARPQPRTICSGGRVHRR